MNALQEKKMDFYEIKGMVLSGRGKATKHLERLPENVMDSGVSAIYPGSLNLVLERPVTFDSSKALVFDFGNRMLWPVSFLETEAWAYRWVGARVHVLEIVSKINLRREHGLSDGDKVSVIVGSHNIMGTPFVAKICNFVCWGGRKHWYYSQEWYNRIIERGMIKKIEAAVGGVQK